MQAYWVTFRNNRHRPVCIEANGGADRAADAIEAVTNTRVVSCKPLPHPAEPRMLVHVDPLDGAARSICFTPIACQGKKVCPHTITCVQRTKQADKIADRIATSSSSNPTMRQTPAIQELNNDKT